MESAERVMLEAEIHAQIGEIERVYRLIEDRQKTKGIAGTESLAYQLHNLYCAFEDLFQIVARVFDNQIVRSERYHIELLKRMEIAVPGVRPAVISDSSFRLLDSLRAFRHFFRHAYAYELDPRKVKLALDDAEELRVRYQEEVDTFLKTLSTEPESPKAET
jgi:uncharacterized protein YutE (UPF0331/DUF86 family)